MSLIALAVGGRHVVTLSTVDASAAAEDEGLGSCQDAPFARPELHPRLEEHSVAGVRVLVLRPARFDPHTRYPVLYLLHGSVSVPDEWVTRMGIEALTAERDVIVVMPDGGRTGMYRDWANGGRQWETFHMHGLIEWVDTTFPTVAARSNRAIAGLSMGGGGAMFYAARHPDLLAAAGSFSGLPLAYVGTAEHTMGAGITYEEQQRCEDDQTGVELFGVYGDPATDEVGVRNRLPQDLAPGLRGMLVYLSAGDGVPADDEQRQLAIERPETTVFEAVVRNHTDALDQTLTELGIDSLLPSRGAIRRRVNPNRRACRLSRRPR